MTRASFALAAVGTSVPDRHGGDSADRTRADISELIDGIYDAALSPQRWPAALAACCDFVGGSSATIISKQISGPGQVVHSDGRVDPHYAELYFTNYHRFDPSNTAHLSAGIDEVLATDDVIDREEFLASRFWTEWACRQGNVDMLVAPIEKHGTGCTLFGVFRHETHGIADDEARRRMALLSPHVRRAASIGRFVDRQRTEASGFRDALDGLAVAVFFVDAAGRLVHANRAGHRMLGNADAIRAPRGRVIPLNRAAGTELAAALAAAGRTSAGSDGRSFVIASPDGTRYVAHVLPLTGGTRCHAAAPCDAVAALFVQCACFEMPSTPELVARAFSLTPSELRVLLSIVEVGGVAETAETIGVGEATIKTHLHRIFSKTETRRQADLVRLVAGFASPLSR